MRKLSIFHHFLICHISETFLASQDLNATVFTLQGLANLDNINPVMTYRR